MRRILFMVLIFWMSVAVPDGFTDIQGFNPMSIGAPCTTKTDIIEGTCNLQVLTPKQAQRLDRIENEKYRH